MTLRLRVLVILAAGLAMGLVLILLSHLNAAHMNELADRIVSVDLERSGLRGAMHVSLDRLRRAQNHFIGGGGEAFQAEVVRQLDLVDGYLEEAKPFLPADGGGSFAELRDAATRLRGISGTLAELHGREARQVETLAGRLRAEARSLLQRLDELRAEGGPSEMLARLEMLGPIAFAQPDLLARVEDALVPAWREALTTQEKHLRGALLRLPAGAGTEAAALRQFGDRVLAHLDRQLDLLIQRADLAERSASLREQRDELVETLWQGALALATDVSRDVAERRSAISARRTTLLYLLGAAFAVGAIAMTALAIFFVSGIERDVVELREVASALERGDLAPRQEFAGSTRELSSLARAFNRLASSLAGVREKQTAYDRIVTGLNRSVQLADILSSSLGELARATRSKAGCVYLKVAGRDELLLAESYGLPRGAQTPDVLHLGEGLVGEVARRREPLLVGDVPRGALKIVSGTIDADVGSVLLVPVIYKDELMGVLELASLSPYDLDTQHFVQDAVFQIAVAINNARAIETIKTTASALGRKTTELEELNAALERANALKSEFLATVSHELRTPLNAIIGFSELVMETDPGISGGSKENLAKVLRNAEHLLSLINDILDLSKIEAGKMEVAPVEVDLRALVLQSVDDFTPAAQRKNVKLKCEVDEFPPAVLIDREKILRIVQNLLSNAVKFTEEGEVQVRLWQEADRLLLRVRDTGIGIDAEALPAIFEKFRQADGSHARRFGGTGLGLAITKELCHAMSGSVRVASRPRKGSTFTVSLPLRLPERTETPRPAEHVA